MPNIENQLLSLIQEAVPLRYFIILVDCKGVYQAYYADELPAQLGGLGYVIDFAAHTWAVFSQGNITPFKPIKTI
jgi:hypothetical protein